MDILKSCETVLRRLREIVPLLPKSSRAVVVLAVVSVPVIFLFAKDIPVEMRFWLVVIEVLFLLAVAILCYGLETEAATKQGLRQEIERLNAALAACQGATADLKASMAAAKGEILEGEMELMKIVGLVPAMLSHVHGIHRILLSALMKLS